SMPARSPLCSTPRAHPSTALRNVISNGGQPMHLNEDGTLGLGDPDAITYASHGEWSVASIGRQVRGRKPPPQLIRQPRPRRSSSPRATRLISPAGIDTAQIARNIAILQTMTTRNSH